MTVSTLKTGNLACNLIVNGDDLMKTAEINALVPKKAEVSVYEYAQLSAKAKERAYSRWAESDNYGWHGENQDVIEAIARNAGVKIKHWEYDTYNHSYKLASANDDTYFNYYREYGYREDYDDIKGLRAVKLAMRLYYRLTDASYAYVQEQGKREWYHGFKPVSWNRTTEEAKPLKWRRSKLGGRETCFTGYIASDVFSTALWDSIKACGTCKYTSLEDHITEAFDKLFKFFEEDYEASTSEEYFTAEVAPQYYYLEDGSVFDHVENVKTIEEG